MPNLAQRVITGIYSAAAGRLYEPVVVKMAFPLLGGDLNEFVHDHGRRAVAVADGRPILDIPVGTAYFAAEMAKAHSGIVVGTDIAWGMVARAATAGVSGLSPVQADAHHLPFAAGSFGAVVCSNGLQVIPGLAPVVRELARVLAPGGMLFVSVVHAPIGAALPKKAAARLPTLLRSGRDVATELAGAGLVVTSYRRTRLAYLIEAHKSV